MRYQARREDAEFVSLRPRRLDDFIGQEGLVSNLRIMISAARLRGEALEHILFSGPPGLGKTTLAHLIAGEMDTSLAVSAGPLLERPGDLVAILSGLAPGQALFIDEIHRLPRGVEETLYSAMEDFRVDIVTGTGPGARTISLPLEPFTLLGATTRSGLLSAPLRDRFGVLFHLEFYTPEELSRIILRAAPALGMSIDDEARQHLASHSRGTPRIALRLLRRMRDFAQVQGKDEIDLRCCVDGLASLGISALGLDRMDREILRAIMDRFAGGPVGLDTLAAVFHEERDVLAEVHEPYLLKLGLLQKTPRGRMVTSRAYEYFGLAAPRELARSEEASLFGEQPD
ncbi:Holliday junction branch migration DNA helicase RuvB [bacterium]|nr:Holliday junction branch migration DNA helicase RuvB [bacterium]